MSRLNFYLMYDMTSSLMRIEKIIKFKIVKSEVIAFQDR